MYPIDGTTLLLPLSYALIVLTAMVGAGLSAVALRTNRQGGGRSLTARYLLGAGISFLLCLFCTLLAGGPPVPWGW